MILFNDEPETDAPGDDPFTDHADNYDGDTVQQLSSMTSDELLEHERYWKWEGERTPATLQPLVVLHGSLPRHG